jgi:basic membrane protein A and related proteins
MSLLVKSVFVALPILFSLVSCSLIVDTSVGAGIGDLCKEAVDCQGAGAICDQGVCSRACTAATECPTGSSCFSGKCSRPVKAGFIYVGVPGDEGWTLTHDLGRQVAVKDSPYLQTISENNIFLTDTGKATIDKMVKDGTNVIFATSDSLREAARIKAKEYPNVNFFVCSGTESGPNLSGYFGRSYQAWYIAGAVAATKTKTGRIAFLGSNVNPELVRHINAYTRGAQSIRSDIKVEVQWEGFWFDQDPPTDWKSPFSGMTERVNREVIVTASLIEHGCDIIAHGSDNSRTVATVESYFSKDFSDGTKTIPNPYKGKVYSIGNDNIDGCRRGPNSCLGSVYWNWGPFYTRVLDEIRKGNWKPQVVNEYIDRDDAKSLFSFGASPNASVLTQPEVQAVGNALADMASRAKDPFRGPLRLSPNSKNLEVGPTGAAADSLTRSVELPDAELAQMCWFVQGVITRNGDGTDSDAYVPNGDTEIQTNLTFDKAPDCRKNR